VVALVKEMHKSSLSTVDGERERSKVRLGNGRFFVCVKLEKRKEKCPKGL
jgi:hypothetical protein